MIEKPFIPAVPEHLRREILAGRCIAFVGAGFSAPVLPHWQGLLRMVANSLPATVSEGQRANLVSLANDAQTALQLEGCGQALRDAFGNTPEGLRAFEAAVSAAVTPSAEANEDMRVRCEALAAIPFRAILTLNYDNLIQTPGGLGQYDSVLRESAYWWNRLDWRNNWRLKTPVIKLHGDANGDPNDNPIVLGRSDYRRILYENGTYSNFMRAALGSYTFLFLGFSFTDAYLNELRSEVLAFLEAGRKGHSGREHPIGYAILEDKPPSIRDFFLEHEGIEVLHYDTEKAVDEKTGQTWSVGWSGFNEWLEAIKEETCVTARLRSLLGKEAKIVWVDPLNDANNQRGIAYLREHVGAEVSLLASADELNHELHQDALLILSHFGYRAGEKPDVARVFEKVNAWGDRPPVVVFGGAEFPLENRRVAQRLGAFELAVDWTDLMRVLELLFGREHIRAD